MKVSITISHFLIACTKIALLQKLAICVLMPLCFLPTFIAMRLMWNGWDTHVKDRKLAQDNVCSVSTQITRSIQYLHIVTTSSA
mmetsp:Transcript_11154/g.11254  ORF Transcript_11154/g.11254 Transcript_11154/m.11254 type:complete len:84 (-) Transcript_11154:752-1003(-)